MRLVRAFGVLAALAALAGCAGPGVGPTTLPYVAAPQPLTPGATLPSAGSPGSGRVAALLPLSGANADLGTAFRNAAMLAFATPGAASLTTLDTDSTPEGARAAAQQALAAGAQVLVGPFTAAETQAVAPLAQAAHVPVLAFTSDPTLASPGVWPLGLTPAEQVDRLVAAAQADGRTRFAAMLPQTPFGDALAQALTQAVANAGLAPPQIIQYGPGFAAMNQAMRSLSDYADRRGPLEARIRAARGQDDAKGRQEAHKLARMAIPPPPFDALLLAATGDNLRQLMPLLPYYDLNFPQVRLLGPAFWAADAGHVSGLNNAWFAAPDPSARGLFAQIYQQRFGAAPPLLADLSFDAAAIARIDAAEGDLTRSHGFAGVDGVLVLHPDGTVTRQLAVFEVGPDGAHLVQPPPSPASVPGT